MRSRSMFAENGLMVAILDAPSDRKNLAGFRQTPEHVADVKATIAWLKQRANLPVWLVGTSRGTQSAAFIATRLVDKSGPDGIVLTSTILSSEKGRPVPDMDLERINIPVLIVHHERDGCTNCNFAMMPRLMNNLDSVRRKELITVKGGQTKGDPCEAMSYHGFNGIEKEVVRRIAGWITSTPPR